MFKRGGYTYEADGVARFERRDLILGVPDRYVWYLRVKRNPRHARWPGGAYEPEWRYVAASSLKPIDDAAVELLKGVKVAARAHLAALRLGEPPRTYGEQELET